MNRVNRTALNAYSNHQINVNSGDPSRASNHNYGDDEGIQNSELCNYQEMQNMENGEHMNDFSAYVKNLPST